MTSRVTIVDYGMANVGSIVNMIKKAGGTADVSSDPAAIAAASRLILPGVGAFDAGMIRLNERGLVEPLRRKALEERVPVLGICLGMQLLSGGSEEGVLPGLGWIDARTRRLDFAGLSTPPRVPHMGWNVVTVRRPNLLLLENLEDPWRFYFVHSYHVVCAREQDVLCTTSYGAPFTSAVASGNIYGVQFHPEKSHAYGMKLLGRFLEL